MKYAAFLRGIMPMNPNMRNEKIRNVFEKLGFKNVQSVIASGNFVFESGIKDSQKLESMIEEALPKNLEFTSTTIVRSQSELKELLNKKPFGKTQDIPTSRLNVTFLKKKTHSQSSAQAKSDMKFPYIDDEKGYSVLGIVDSAVCSVIDLSGAKTPDVMLWLEKQFGKEITTRTLKTVTKILDKMER